MDPNYRRDFGNGNTHSFQSQAPCTLPTEAGGKSTPAKAVDLPSSSPGGGPEDYFAAARAIWAILSANFTWLSSSGL